MVLIVDNYSNKFEIILKSNNFYELFGSVYNYMSKSDPFIDFDNIILSFTKDDIIYNLEHNLESKTMYDSQIEEYNISIIEKNKSFKYYYNNLPKKIIVKEISNINNFIIKLCKKENLHNGNYIIILQDFITEIIYYKCYLDVIINEYWDKNEKEFAYKKAFNIYNNNVYIYDYKNNFNNIIYKLKVISL